MTGTSINIRVQFSYIQGQMAWHMSTINNGDDIPLSGKLNNLIHRKNHGCHTGDMADKYDPGFI